MISSRAVIGLGNPGRRYTNTRHNLGFRVIDIAQSGFDGRVEEVGGKYWIKEAESAENRLFFVKPLTFMNRSGSAVRQFIEETGLPPAEVLAVCDDVYLTLGRLRLRKGGSSGGHNGLESLIGSLGTDEFPRLRVGVGPVPEGVDLVEFVLSDFSSDEEDALNCSVGLAADCVAAFLREGMEAGLNQISRQSTACRKEGGD